MASFNELENRVYDCIIIGSGISGLSCARKLVDEYAINPTNILVVEANSYVGGRILQDESFVQGVKLELGAEILHGSDTNLTKFAKEQNEPIQEIFCWAHGDGGPAKNPVNKGYGLYYISATKSSSQTDKPSRLLRFDDSSDPDFTRTNDIIWNISENDEVVGKRFRSNSMSSNGDLVSDNISILDFLIAKGVTNEDMLAMVDAGFSNTLCTSNMNLSYKQCKKWFKTWDSESPEAEDYKFTNSYSVFVDYLKNKINIKVDFPIQKIQYGSSQDILVDQITSNPSLDNESLESQPTTCSVEDSTIGGDNKLIRLIGADKSSLLTKTVVVTASPYVLSNKILVFEPELTKDKIEALQCLEINIAMKIYVKFSSKCWPKDLQGMIMSGSECLIPEVWFRDVSDKVAGHNRQIDSEFNSEVDSKSNSELDSSLGGAFESATCYATGFATSKYAEELLRLGSDEKIIDCLLDQLEKVFSLLEPKHMAADLTESEIELPQQLPKPRDVFLGGKIQHWSPSTSPYIGGGYCSPLAGKSTNYPEILAAPLSDNIFFAGEATNTNAGGTVHSAYDTGLRAASEVANYLSI
mmetsp:Transcript_17436/g.15719  ORF Transcript_17436/g.15719 Transcript_17436/m.15719 type:complete len:582 (-) Transcript_17436:129-1874(-)